MVVSIRAFPDKKNSAFCVLVLGAALLAASTRLLGQNTTDVRNDLLAAQDVEQRLTSAIANGVDMYVPEQAAITIKFHSGGKLSGSSGVNRYCGGIELMADGVFRWDAHGFARTNVLGEPVLMAFEEEFLQRLRNTSVIRIADGGIIMASADGLTTFKFVAMTPPETIAKLQNLELKVVRLVFGGKEMALRERAEITFTLSEGTRFSGRSVINLYSGEFAVKPEGTVDFVRAQSTQRDGSTEDMELETAYFGALVAAQRFRSTDKGFILENLDKTAVVEFAPPVTSKRSGDL
jgi:heat shock protein HslJ